MMTIDEFIEHLKHKSLKIQIREEHKNTIEVVFNGDVGIYLNWIERKMYGKFMISNIVPNTKGFIIWYKL